MNIITSIKSLTIILIIIILSGCEQKELIVSLVTKTPTGAVFTIHNWPLSNEIMDKLNEKN